MNLRAGRPLSIAPNFHLRPSWSERLLLATGTQHGEPCGPWREPTAAELALLILEDATVARDALRNCLCLFQIPGHLRSAFWTILERDRELSSERAEPFFFEVGEFLDFKQLPVPTRAVYEITAGNPGQTGVLGSSATLPIWGAINLDDEATSVAFVNLSADEMRDLTQDSGPDTGLTERFLATFPNYPPVRLRLEPGEGFRLPAGGIPMSAWTLEKREFDVMLLIRSEEGVPHGFGRGVPNL